MDIYFDKNYGKLWEKIEGGEAVNYYHESDLGKISYSFIKRRLPQMIDQQQYFDIITPYGYSGPWICACKGRREALIEEFNQEFLQYCQKERIVSEFVRFHPLLKNHQEFAPMFHPEERCKTVGIQVRPSRTIAAEFSKICQARFRKAQHAGFDVSLIHPVKDLSQFGWFYREQMRLADAADWYIFDDEHFEKVVELYGEHLLLIKVTKADQIIGMQLAFVWEKWMHIHLSCCRRGNKNWISPYIYMLGLAAEWAERNEIAVIHLGGGLENGESDCMYQTKKKLTHQGLYDFFVAKRIHLPAIYHELCQKAGVQDMGDYFPIYRPIKVRY